MHNRPVQAPSEVPPPSLGGTWVALGAVAAERVPVWAAHWLVAGHDGDALRTLAGLSRRDWHDVHDLLPGALVDCGVSIPDSDRAAASAAFTTLARMHADGRAAEPWVLDKVEEIVERSDYADSVLGLPLGRIYGLAEEWRAGWRTAEQLTAEVQRACTEQLAMEPTATDTPSSGAARTVSEKSANQPSPAATRPHHPA